MSSDNFIDEIRVCVRSGKGGAGAVHFHRDKFTSKGGPDGGDGGRGGHIIVRANKNYWTLFHLRYRKHLLAENGKDGGEARKTGKSGKDLWIDVPEGTVVKYEADGSLMAEVLKHGDKAIIMEGGKGGLGNWHFKSAQKQIPKYAQPGIAGKEAWVVFEMKLLADVGLVGFPNAGKSTLISHLTAATPKIADYAFTTLKPQLGVVAYYDGKSFVMADIPGIIEGAHEGKGLGLRFLRHIERNAVLLFCISAESLEIKQQYEQLLAELRAYNPLMIQKNRVLAITKADLLDETLIAELKSSLPEDLKCVFISAITGHGLKELKDTLWQELKNSKENTAFES